jgi:CheY-like chemotaxis protein
VVSNLLTNASKYSEAGSEVRVFAERTGDKVCLRVEDDGIGITRDMLESIFEAFVQQRRGARRSSGGLGIDLTIVKNLVRLHGGTVVAHSDGPGKGSQFVVELPIGSADLPTIQAKPSPSGSPRATEPKRILVVDDSDDTAETFAEALSQLGHRVAVDHDGASALEIAGDFQPEVAFLDIGLPGMDGYELAQRLRELPELRGGVRLVALTGYGQDNDRIISQKAGFAAHLVKPVGLQSLAEAVLSNGD